MLVVAASLAVGGLVFVDLVLAHRPPGWDEAAHALQGALIAHDIREGDLLSLLFDTYRQIYWPPLHSWLIGIPFLVTGPDLEVARSVSVVAFVLLAPTLFLVARTIEPAHDSLAGSLTAGLVLTCPGIVALAAAAMLELPALLALGCTMLVYCRLARDPTVRPEGHALLGVCTVLTYLVKTNFGVLLVICIVLAKLIAVGFRPRALLTRQNLFAVIPLVVFCAIWFADPRRLVSTWDSLVNSPWGGEEATGFEGLLFFPRSIVELSGAASLLLLGGLVLTWKARRDPAIAFLLVLALTQFVIGEFHHTKLDRHIVPMLPPMFVLTGVAGARLWDWLLARGMANRRMAAAFLAGLAVLQVASMGVHDRTPVVQAVLPHAARHGAEVLRYVSTQVREQAPALVLDTTMSWPHPHVVDWHLVSSGVLPVTAAGSAMEPRRERQLAMTLDELPLPIGMRAQAKRMLRRYDTHSVVRTIHSFDRLKKEPDEFVSFLDATIRADPPNVIIALTGASDTTRVTTDSVEPGILRRGYRRVSVREFSGGEGARSRVYVYRRP